MPERRISSCAKTAAIDASATCLKALGHLPLAVDDAFPPRLWKACGKGVIDVKNSASLLPIHRFAPKLYAHHGGTMKSAIYARVSTFDQEPENQLAELRRYTTARSWTSSEYVDRGVSGAKAPGRSASRSCP